jgi:hypothetical protein
MSPGWRKEWHVGVRATKSRKLVASICGVPTDIRVRGQKIRVTEINFLCIHKKLRSKRLTPVLIKEITRRCYLNGIYQAIYTAGVILPTPVSSCRYYHRPLDWLKLYEVGFSPLPHGSTKARQITKNHLPSSTSTPGLRPMEEKDVDAVHDLLERYLKRFDMNPAFKKDEIDHWLLHRPNAEKEQVIWSYVVEDPESHKITDFVSFYNLESTVIQHPKHDNVRAAYLYYYATETAFTQNDKALKERLLMLLNDALILAKQVRLSILFRVMEANVLYLYRRTSTFSTHLRSTTTHCSLSSSSLALATASFTSTCTTIAPPLSPVGPTIRIYRTRGRWGVLGLLCCRLLLLVELQEEMGTGFSSAARFERLIYPGRLFSLNSGFLPRYTHSIME